MNRQKTWSETGCLNGFKVPFHKTIIKQFYMADPIPIKGSKWIALSKGTTGIYANSYILDE